MTDYSFERGHVVWHPAYHRDEGGRPYLIVSGDNHPFHGEEYIALGITTTEQDEAVEITPDDWATGSIPRTSYVISWYISTLKHANITQGVGAITDDALHRVQDEIKANLFPNVGNSGGLE